MSQSAVSSAALFLPTPTSRSASQTVATKPPKELRFADLITLEPRLSDLDARARGLYATASRRKRRCGVRLFYDKIQPEMIQLVGNRRGWVHPVLSSTAAFVCAYNHLFSLRSARRGCGCAIPSDIPLSLIAAL